MEGERSIAASTTRTPTHRFIAKKFVGGVVLATHPAFSFSFSMSNFSLNSPCKKSIVAEEKVLPQPLSRVCSEAVDDPQSPISLSHFHSTPLHTENDTYYTPRASIGPVRFSIVIFAPVDFHSYRRARVPSSPA